MAKEVVPQTPAEVIKKALVAQYIQKASQGKNLSPDEWRLVMDDVQVDLCWPDRRSCAKELSKELGRVFGNSTLYELKRQGAPIPTRGPINKQALWKWLALEKREKGKPGEEGGDSRSLREQKLAKEIEMITARLSALQGSMLDADYVESVLRTCAENTRNAFRHDFPVKVFSACVGKTSEEAVEAIQFHVDEVLSNFTRAIENIESTKQQSEQ
jgi:hypothetical protein